MIWDYDFSKSMDQFSETKFWVQAINEFVGTMLWFLLAHEAGSEWAVGVTYVVVQAAMCACSDSDSVHMFTPYTLYKMFEGKNLDPLKGLIWVGLQIFGAWAGGKLGSALGMAAYSNDGISAAWDWQIGFRHCFAVVFIMHVFLMANDSDRDCGIQTSFLTIFGFTICGWFLPAGDSVNFVNQFGDDSEIANVWIHLVWTLIAVVCVLCKREFLYNKK